MNFKQWIKVTMAMFKETYTDMGTRLSVHILKFKLEEWDVWLIVFNHMINIFFPFKNNIRAYYCFYLRLIMD